MYDQKIPATAIMYFSDLQTASFLTVLSPDTLCNIAGVKMSTASLLQIDEQAYRLKSDNGFASSNIWLNTQTFLSVTFMALLWLLFSRSQQASSFLVHWITLMQVPLATSLVLAKGDTAQLIVGAALYSVAWVLRCTFSRKLGNTPRVKQPSSLLILPAALTGIQGSLQILL